MGSKENVLANPKKWVEQTFSQYVRMISYMEALPMSNNASVQLRFLWTDFEDWSAEFGDIWWCIALWAAIKETP